jgi:hypothetical protein
VLPRLAVDGEVTSKLRTTAEAHHLSTGANYPRHRQDWRYCTGGVSKVQMGGNLMKRQNEVAASVAVFDVAGATGAVAGEVKGPPGVVDNTNETGALDHANSACAASGLNDFDSEEGQNVSQVQTAADSWKYYGLPKGSPGTLGLCRGGAG